jgi:polyisoprenoid-binding protein YceI
MKFRIIILAILTISSLASAQKYISKNAHIFFYSYTPLEDIEANNNQVASILDAATGTLQFSLLVKSFEFKKTLMGEHFNENYIESDKFPKASFNGKITNFDKVDLKKDGSYPVEVKGDLTLHGVTNPVTINGTIDVSKGIVSAKSKFNVVPQDYKISIPDLVKDKIAKEITVSVDVTYN